MVYHDIFARLNPADRFWEVASGNKSGCPWGTDAKRHAAADFKSIVLWLASKSST